uniref:hypothetical protein n=1 Tax=Mariniflexile sp. TaxID=1979402 RepID=UPI004047DC02
MKNSVLLLVVILSFIPLLSCSQENVTHPYWAPKTWELRPDDITTIMGFRAELSGNLNHLERPTPTVVNNAFIRGFFTKNDLMTWEVEVPYEADYSIALMYTGSNDILSQSTFEVSSGATTIIEKANIKNWETRPMVQRHYLNQNNQTGLEFRHYHRYCHTNLPFRY